MKMVRNFFIFVLAAVFMAAAVNAKSMEKIPKVDNFIFLYDASGSMNDDYPALEEMKAVLAKDAMKTIQQSIPALGYKAGLFTLAPDFKTNYPLAEFSRPSYGEAIEGLTVPSNKIGVETPLASGIRSLDSVLSGLSGETAAVLFSDGCESMGGDPPFEVDELSSKYDVCFHVVSFAHRDKGKRILEEVVNARDCSTLITAGDFFRDEESRCQFIKNIFYTTEKDSDGDGVADSEDKCPNTPEGVAVYDNGCPVDSDGDGVFDYKDKCANTPEGAAVNEAGCWVVEDLRFEVDKAYIQPSYHDNLRRVVMVLKKNPEIDVEIQGHTDSQGSEAYNLKLSERRARAVHDYLVESGIDPDRLSYKGYGESRPVAGNKTAEGRAKNRRVEIKPVY